MEKIKVVCLFCHRIMEENKGSYIVKPEVIDVKKNKNIVFSVCARCSKPKSDDKETTGDTKPKGPS